MIVPVRYGGGFYDLSLPDDNPAEIIEPGRAPVLNLDHTLQNKRLPEKFFSGSSRILVIINDAFRATPSYLILDKILPELSEKNDVRIIIASGLHSRPSEDEYRRLIGKHFEKFDNEYTWSNSRDFESFQKAGNWDDGGEVFIHDHFFRADEVIVIGSVEPHYFAGFTGGIKSIVPGLCYYKTIEHNHRKAISPHAQPGKTSGNPVWEELWSTLKLIDEKRIFSCQIVQDSNRNIIGLFSGGLSESYRRAIEFCEDIYIHDLSDKYDLVIAEHSPPLDRNLYQLQKCFENTKAAVKDGGTLLMFSACKDGIGTRDFYDLAEKYPNPETLLKQEKIGFDLGIHKLYRTALLTNRANLCLMSFLPDEIVRKVYLKPVADANAFIRDKFSAISKARTLIVKDAGHTVIRTLE